MANATFTALFTTAGTFTWVAPAGVTAVSVECWGGGGGSGGGSTADNNNSAGGGGGEYAAELTNTCVAGDSYTVVVGAAGTGGAAGDNAGGAGGSSSFTGTSATTVTAHGGGGGAGGSTGTGGTAGTGSSNTVHHNGGAGGNGVVSDAGGGGGSGGTSAAGNNGGSVTAGSGGGAAAVTGGGPGGNVAAASPGPGQSPVSGPGGGGGGADDNGLNEPGANGWAGQVRVIWTMATPAVIAANTSGGTWQWTAPAGITSVDAQAIGAGAAGGGATSTSTTTGGGGGGGEDAEETALAVTASSSYTFTVGAGGAGVSAGTGGGGGNSTMAGDAATVTAHGGSGGAEGTNGALGAGGTGSSNTTHNNGGAGAAGTTNSHGGGGGSSGGTSAAGNAGSGATGGSAVTGGGPGGTGASAAHTAGSKPASGPGGGGGGARGGTGSVAGGAGFDGQLTLTWSSNIAGAAAMSAAASVTAANVQTLQETAAMSAAASVSAAAVETLQQAAALSAAASVTAAAAETLEQTAVLSAAASLTAVPPAPPVHGLTAQIYTGTWEDISKYVYQRDTVQLQRGRQNEASTLQPATATLTLNNRDGRFTTRNPAGAYYPNLVQNTPLRLSVLAADCGLPGAALRLETDTTSYASCPDSAGLQITSGTLSVRIDCQITDWTGVRSVIGKYGTTLAAQAWILQTTGGGILKFFHIDSGGGGHTSLSSVPVPYYSGRIGLRADYNISAQTVTFYTAPTMGGAWTQLGPAVSTPATSLAAASGQGVLIGYIAGATVGGMYGQVWEAQILQTGTLKADPQFYVEPAGTTSFTDAQSNTWSLTGTAEITDRLYRFHGEMSAVPKTSDASAEDVYSQATAYGVSQRLQAANEPIGSPMYRAYIRLPSDLNIAAYWPCEDGTNARTIGSAVGGPPMQIIGGPPELAANSDFACSSPLPVMNGAQFLGVVPAGTTFTDCSVRLLLSVPSGGETNGTFLAGVTYSGATAAYGLLEYTTGGYLSWTLYNAAGSPVVTTDAQLMGYGGPGVFIPVDGLPMRVACDVITDGTSITLSMTTIQPGNTTGVQVTNTLASAVCGQVSSMFVSGVSSAVGHVSVQGVADSLFDLAGPMDAWSGETAGARIARLCDEESIGCRMTGPPDLSYPMGYQPIDTLWDILQECEQTDLGMLTEPRQAAGIGYRTRTSLYHQTAAAVADYPSQEIFAGFGSTADTQLTVNDVTAQAPDGSIARQVLQSGPMSVLAPPDGIGRIATQIQPNPELDSQLNNLAAWYLSVRAVDDDRYPAIPFVMNRPETPLAVAVADLGDLLQLTGTPVWLPPPPVSQLQACVNETFFPAPYWLLQVNGIPELPYETAVFDTAKFDTGGSTLTNNITAAATSFSVTMDAGVRRWTTSAGSFPFDIVIDREQMTVSDITGTGPQTFTVTRAVNGVTIPHTAGAPVALYRKPVLAL